jgi:hypothetical protein
MVAIRVSQPAGQSGSLMYRACRKIAVSWAQQPLRSA